MDQVSIKLAAIEQSNSAITSPPKALMAKSTMCNVERLSDFPCVTVQIECHQCPHGYGSYRFARFAAKFGADTMLTEVLDRIAFDCPWRTPPGKRLPDPHDSKCKARFTEL
jgi:hypothetical protein